MNITSVQERGAALPYDRVSVALYSAAMELHKQCAEPIWRT
jgi:hypothetical protein